jgi:formylglycine-generating enzyme required for sulfatase activity
MRFSSHQEGPFQEVPLLQGVPCLAVEVEPGSGVLGFFLECQPLWGAITVSAPWVRVAPREAPSGQSGGSFRLLVNPEAAGGPGQYLAQLDLGGQALAVVLRIHAAPAAAVPPAEAWGNQSQPGPGFLPPPPGLQAPPPGFRPELAGHLADMAPATSRLSEARPAPSGGRGHWGWVAAGVVVVLLLGLGAALRWARPSLPPGLTSLGTNAQGFQEYRWEKDGSVLVRVPAGAFLMGSQDGDADADDDEKPAHEVYLDEYWIGKCEVTNEQFARFVAETGYDAGNYWRNSASEWGPQAPVVYVSWFDARAYCEWAGGRLPTEAEWEKAARGTDGRKYPWGNAWDSSRAWCEETSGGRAHPVGQLPAGASPYGCLDMAGNVWEWCQDWYGEYPSGPSEGSNRVRRGGSWGNDAQFARAAERGSSTPDYRNDFLGFRLARSLP